MWSNSMDGDIEVGASRRAEPAWFPLAFDAQGLGSEATGTASVLAIFNDKLFGAGRKVRCSLRLPRVMFDLIAEHRR